MKYFDRIKVDSILFFLLSLFLLLDTGYTFFQHATKGLDGDLVPIVLPAERYQEVLSDPFGFQVLTENKTYAAPNRFFVHWYLSSYFKMAPKLLQKLVTPVESVYCAGAISKTLIHLILIALLAYLISGVKRLWSKEWLLAAVIIVPMFQTGGHFYKYMGVVDQSITYSSFYALPMALLILFLLPYYKRFSGQELKLRWWQNIGLLLLTLVLPFSGPLVPGVVLVIAFLWGSMFLLKIGKTRRLDQIKTYSKPLVLYFIWLTFLSLYSIYIGKNNAENFNVTPLSLFERYQKLPVGLYYQLTQKLALPLLILLVFTNTCIAHRFNIQKKKSLNLLKWIGFFALIYLLLLPLGGSREYRPYILRKDTMLPIILALIFYYGQSTFWIIKHSGFKYWKGYLVAIFLFSLIFSYADESDSGQYICERNALIEMSKSKEEITKLNADCTILSWDIIRDPKASVDHARLFKIWNITEEEQRFYQESN